MCYYMWLADGTKYGVQEVKASHNTRIYKGSFTYKGTTEADAENVSFSGGEFLDTASGFTPNYVLSDRLGSTRVVMDSKGSTIVRNSYYPFGLTHYNSLYNEKLLKTNRYHFNGKEKQTFSTLIDYHLLDYGSRMYDPYLCRWTTPDPADQLLNPYIFSGNNPVNFYDPDGEWFISALLGGFLNVGMDALFGNLNKDSKWYDWLVSFGIGAGSAMLGVGIESKLMSMTEPLTGFMSGFITGGLSGFAAGMASTGYQSIKNRENFQQYMDRFLSQGVTSFITSGIMGGIWTGFANLKEGVNFWDGAPIGKETITDFKFEHFNTGDANCVFDAFAYLAKKYGFDVNPNYLRSMVMGGDPNLNVLNTSDPLLLLNDYFNKNFHITSLQGPEKGMFKAAVEHMKAGRPVSFFKHNAQGQPGHFVLSNELIQTTFFNRSGGIRRIKYNINVMSPGSQGGQYVKLKRNYINGTLMHYKY